MRERIPCPAPGVYEGVPAETYHAWEAASNSTLNLIEKRSEAHARFALDNPREHTDATRRGDALHLAVLEPHLFDSRYAISSDCEEPLKTGARSGQPCGSPGKVFISGRWLCGTHGKGDTEEQREVLTAADYEICQGMRRAVLAHPVAADLLAATDRREVSIVFDWPGTQIRCKARIDVPAWEAREIGDFKTTQDASEREFKKSIVKYGYHRQAPFYMTGCRVLGHPVEDFLFIPVEAEAPHGVNVFRLDDAAVRQGAAELPRLLQIWDRCIRSGVWSSYRTGIHDISLPGWYGGEAA